MAAATVATAAAAAVPRRPTPRMTPRTRRWQRPPGHHPRGHPPPPLRASATPAGRRPAPPRGVGAAASECLASGAAGRPRRVTTCTGPAPRRAGRTRRHGVRRARPRGGAALPARPPRHRRGAAAGVGCPVQGAAAAGMGCAGNGAGSGAKRNGRRDPGVKAPAEDPGGGLRRRRPAARRRAGAPATGERPSCPVALRHHRPFRLAGGQGGRTSPHRRGGHRPLTCAARSAGAAAVAVACAAARARTPPWRGGVAGRRVALEKEEGVTGGAPLPPRPAPPPTRTVLPSLPRERGGQGAVLTADASFLWRGHCPGRHR